MLMRSSILTLSSWVHLPVFYYSNIDNCVQASIAIVLSLALGGLNFAMKEDNLEKIPIVLLLLVFLAMIMNQFTGLISRRWISELRGRREDMVSCCFGMNVPLLKFIQSAWLKGNPKFVVGLVLIPHLFLIFGQVNLFVCLHCHCTQTAFRLLLLVVAIFLILAPRPALTVIFVAFVSFALLVIVMMRNEQIPSGKDSTKVSSNAHALASSSQSSSDKPVSASSSGPATDANLIGPTG